MANKRKHNDACDSLWLSDRRPAEFGEVPMDTDGYEFSPNTVEYVTASNMPLDIFYDSSSGDLIDARKYRHI